MAPRTRRLLEWTARYSLAVALAFMFLAPFAFIVLTAVMTDQQALTRDLWPREWRWGNFVEVFRRAPLLRYVGNTMLYALGATAFMLLSSIPAAYALARLRWRGQGLAFLLVLAMMMLPPQVTQVPLYILWARLDLTGSLWPLVLPNLFGDAFSIFLLRQFLLTIPREYADAARVDGCGELRVLWRVILPMARPGIAAAAMFMFFFAWNDYYGPVLYTSENPASWPVSVGLASFRNLYQVQWNLVMATTVLVTAPVLALFFAAQRTFVEGVTLTGVKG